MRGRSTAKKRWCAGYALQGGQRSEEGVGSMQRGYRDESEHEGEYMAKMLDAARASE